MTQSSAGRKPDVSVVMSCFNGERWIAGAIESVLGQTFRHYEFLLIDDGSTDSTVDTIRRYCGQDERVVLIEKPHTDQSDSLNLGLARATGTWAARLDQDDLWAPTRLAEQMSYVSEHADVVFVGSAFVRLDEQGRELNTHGFPAAHHRLMVNLERMKGFCPHSTALFRLDLARRVGGYRTHLNNANDHDLWLRLSSLGRLACLPAPLVQCRGHSGQMSHEEGGITQVVHGVAGGACHFLRRLGGQDPLAQGNDSRASDFLAFVRQGVQQSGLMARRGAWGEARAKYFKRKNRLIAAVVFLGALIRSGHAGRQLWEKFFGLSLPRKLAREWIRGKA